MKVNGQWVPCVHNSIYSNSVIPIDLKLYRCLGRALKMCMWFEYNPHIMFYYIFRNLNLVAYRAFTLIKRMYSGNHVCQTPTVYMPIPLKRYICYEQMLYTCTAIGIINFEKHFLNFIAYTMN